MFNKSQLKYAALIVLVLLLAVRLFGKSGYTAASLLKPVDMSVKTTDESDFFSLPYDIKCVPGLPDSESMHSWGLTPGGICGDQALIRKQMREYTIQDGIGGDLLEKF